MGVEVSVAFFSTVASTREVGPFGISLESWAEKLSAKAGDWGCSLGETPGGVYVQGAHLLL